MIEHFRINCYFAYVLLAVWKYFENAIINSRVLLKTIIYNDPNWSHKSKQLFLSKILLV